MGFTLPQGHLAPGKYRAGSWIPWESGAGFMLDEGIKVKLGGRDRRQEAVTGARQALKAKDARYVPEKQFARPR
jgi:hypothetical protein